MSHRDWTLRKLLTANDERCWERNELGPTIEEFASEHQLPLRWVELRNTCDRLVERADFWYRADLRNAARPLAVEASDILLSSLKRRGRSPQGGMPQACPQDVDETIGSGYESADRQQTDPRKSKELSFARTDTAYMRRAIALARIALANGDTPVGSLVVHKRKIIAEGVEAVKKQMDVSGHAELIAIRNACSALRHIRPFGLYTLHYRRTLFHVLICGASNTYQQGDHRTTNTQGWWDQLAPSDFD
jgi:hypothetical protein